MYGCVVIMLLKNFVQDAPRKEIVIAPIEEYSTTTALQNSL